MPEKFSVNIEPEAFNDIQEAINYYNSCKPGLGKEFLETIKKQIILLRKYHHSFAIRYDNIRCLPVKKFPYMIHYEVKEKKFQISIKAVFCNQAKYYFEVL
jgi:hypothetical protein